jgi:hypothetical protein
VAALAGLALAASACATRPLTCTTEATLPLVVLVRDSVSDTLLTNAVVYASMGARTDSLVITPSNPPFARPLAWAIGVYEVEARAAGYATWTSTATITYKSKQCGKLQSLQLTALMQKSQ